MSPWSSPSRTSQAVARVRAQLSRPRTPDGDADAQAKLCDGMGPPRSAWLWAHLSARTRFFDDQVLAALDRGVGQIVILGAGYDDRALRFRSPGVQYFELDHPATQVDKLRRLTDMHADFARLTLAPIDFRSDDVGAVLAACGHDADRASLFMCEGVLVYLDQATTVGLLRGARVRAHDPASRLAISVAIHADDADTKAVVARANAVRRNAATEPWQTILPASAQRDLLARGGWSVEHAVDDSLFDRNANSGRSLLVVARPDSSGGEGQR